MFWELAETEAPGQEIVWCINEWRDGNGEQTEYNLHVSGASRKIFFGQSWANQLLAVALWRDVKVVAVKSTEVTTIS